MEIEKQQTFIKEEKMKTKTELMYATMRPWRLFFIVAMPGMVSMFAMSIYSVFIFASKIWFTVFYHNRSEYNVTKRNIGTKKYAVKRAAY